MSIAGWLAAEPVRMTDMQRATRETERADRREAQEAAEQAAAAAEAHEARMFRFHQLGIEPGAVTGRAFAAMDEDGEYEAARAVMERIERRREARQRVAEHEAQRVASVARSDQPRWIDDANAVSAALRVEQLLHSEPRPFAARGYVSRSAAVRSEDCLWCVEQGVSDEEAFLLHTDPQFAVPVTTVSDLLDQRERDQADPNPGRAVNSRAVANGWCTPAGELVR
jgi:hypothetical protein